MRWGAGRGGIAALLLPCPREDSPRRAAFRTHAHGWVAALVTEHGYPSRHGGCWHCWQLCRAPHVTFLCHQLKFLSSISSREEGLRARRLSCIFLVVMSLGLMRSNLFSQTCCTYLKGKLAFLSKKPALFFKTHVYRHLKLKDSIIH